jgi:hypothetical protein
MRVFVRLPAVNKWITAAVGCMRGEFRSGNERIDKFILGVFNRDP